MFCQHRLGWFHNDQIPKVILRDVLFGIDKTYEPTLDAASRWQGDAKKTRYPLVKYSLYRTRVASTHLCIIMTVSWVKGVTYASVANADCNAL